MGLGLDYDIFLLTRIREYRAMGVSDPGIEDTNNVLMGLALTGGVITAAGRTVSVFLAARLVDYFHVLLLASLACWCFPCSWLLIAGAIMAIAFVGLLFSGEPILNQLSFFLVFSVLFDTLVVRSILVPAMMTMLGRWNWWPGSVLPAGQSYSVQSEHQPLLS